MSAPGRDGRARDALLPAAAAVLLYLAAGAGGFGFVNYDDPDVVQGNPVQSISTLGSAFTGRMAHAWLPLYSLSLGLDNALFGPGRPGAYHLHSVLLHALNAALVLLLARRLGLGRGAALAAGLLFAVHPAVTESVAWVASRKDLLSFAFAACAVLCFLRAEEEPRKPLLHAAGALLLALGMLAKGTVVVVPALLAIAVLARAPDAASRRRGLGATIPYVAVAAALAAVHLAVARSEGTAAADLGAGDTPGARTVAGVAALGKYLLVLVLPAGLSVEHGISPGSAPAGQIAAGAGALLGLGGIAVVLWKRGPAGRAAALALAGLLVALAPFNGVIPRTSVLYAERYLYLPAAVGCGILGSVLTARWLATCAVLAFSVLTFLHLPVWKDSLSLWENAVETAPEAHVAHAKHGEALADAALAAGEAGERSRLFERAVVEQARAADLARFPLEEVRARHDLGVACLGAGKPAEALVALERARTLVLGAARAVATPAFRASVEVNRGKALEALRREPEARAALEALLREDPSSAAAWHNLGILRLRAGEIGPAREALLAATKADEAFVGARLALADLEAQTGDLAAALRIAVRAAEAFPRDANALACAGQYAFLLGQPLRSEEWCRKALALDPALPAARRGLAGALVFRSRSAREDGKTAEALRLAREAAAMDPEGADPRFALGEALQAGGDGAGAMEAYLQGGKRGAPRPAAAARARLLLAHAQAARGKGQGASARDLCEKALAEGADEIRTGGRRPPLREETRWIPAAPAGGEARADLLDALLALAAGEEGAAAAAAGLVAGREAPRDGGAPGPLYAAALVVRSRARVLADELDAAAGDLETLLDASASSARARFLLGTLLSARAARRRADGRKPAATADAARAEALLREARAADPSLVEASIALAEMYFVEGRVVDSIRELNGVLDADPRRVEAHLVLGNIMKAQYAADPRPSTLEAGEEHFRRALSIDPGDARALAGLGELAAFSNRPQDALACAQRALVADPDLPAARALGATMFLRAGRARLEDGDAAAALEAAVKADRLGGETAAVCLLRADAFRKGNEWEKAGREVERARALDPGSPEVKDALAAHYRDVGYAFLLHRRRDQAEEAFRRALAAGSDRVDLSEVRRVLERGGEPAAPPGGEPVSPAVAEALSRARDEAEARWRSGADLYREGKHGEAAERFRASLRAFETAPARFGLGLALAAGGDLPGAEKEYRNAVADDPSHADAWLNLGALLYRRGEDAEAGKAYARYLEKAPATGAEDTVLKVRALLAVLQERRAAGEGKE